jgi:hypothetical protein
VSGPDGSSTKGNTPGAARVPGLSHLRVYRPEANIRRQVHGLYFLTASNSGRRFFNTLLFFLFFLVFLTIYVNCAVTVIPGSLVLKRWFTYLKGRGVEGAQWFMNEAAFFYFFVFAGHFNTSGISLTRVKHNYYITGNVV